MVGQTKMGAGHVLKWYCKRRDDTQTCTNTGDLRNMECYENKEEEEAGWDGKTRATKILRDSAPKIWLVYNSGMKSLGAGFCENFRRSGFISVVLLLLKELKTEAAAASQERKTVMRSCEIKSGTGDMKNRYEGRSSAGRCYLRDGFE